MPDLFKVIVDSIHGDIRLNDLERRIVDTATFQRLRRIKQLSMGQVTYPNATHSRFAHSLGVFQIMQRITRKAEETEALSLDAEQMADLKLAALLHDIGHYPYSHLMEKIDKVLLTEDLLQISSKHTVNAAHTNYPDHEELGQAIVTSQGDLLNVLGSKDRAERIARLFNRTTTDNAQLSKLLHSSMDTDRLDYLIRDSRAAGVPYGEVDLNYLLNNLRISKEGRLGVKVKALPAVEQFLLARYFMYRTVYYHKTTVALEECCRQLLRRIRNRGQDGASGETYGLPPNGDGILDIVKSDSLWTFDDSFVDTLIQRAANDEEPVVRGLAMALRLRQPPKLLCEVSALDRDGKGAIQLFKAYCKYNLKNLADKYKIPLGVFLFHEMKPLKFEARKHHMTKQEHEDLPSDEMDESILIFEDDSSEPKSIVDLPYSLLKQISGVEFHQSRLYVVKDPRLTSGDIENLKREVSNWALST